MRLERIGNRKASMDNISAISERRKPYYRAWMWTDSASTAVILRALGGLALCRAECHVTSWRRLTWTVERPAAVFLMTPRPLCTGFVQKALSDVLPDGMLAVEPDGIDLLDL